MSGDARRGRRGAAALLAAALVAGAPVACGIDTDREPRVIPPDNVPAELRGATTTSTTQPLDDESGVAVRVWFVRSIDGQARLFEWVRRVPAPATDRNVLEALLDQPPTEAEREDEGLTTAIPESTTLASQPEREDRGVLVVDLSDAMFQVQSQELRIAYGQIVCTATAIDGVERVRFENEGSPIRALDGTGESAEGPVDCDDYDTLIGAAPS